MGRPPRAAAGGYVYHVLNRANARARIFDHAGDYAAFEQVLVEAISRSGMRLLSYCVMPNHWHLVVWPREDGELSRFVGWLTLTHTQRWHAYRGTAGCGHLYQGRFKSFPVETDEHLFAVARYVERNPLRARLVERAEDWKWSSLARWLRKSHEDQSLLTPWPIPRESSWVERVNAPLTPAEQAALQACIERGRPFGSPLWSEAAIERLGLQSTMRGRGRPRRSA
ncbi:MAG: transposase [Pirellulales bacterium]